MKADSRLLIAKQVMNKVRDYIIKIRIGELVYSIFFAIMCVFERNVTNIDATPSTLATTYITTIGPIDIILFPVITVLVYCVIQIVKVVIPRVSSYLTTGEARKNRWYILPIVFICIVVVYIPYLMSYWPGGIYNDTLDSIHIALRKQPMDNQNTVLYALIWRFFFWIGGLMNQGEYGGLKMFTVASVVLVALTLSVFVYWLYRRGVRLWVVIALTVVFATVPIFPYYGISLWKDTPFGIVLFLYTILLASISLGKKSAEISRKQIALFIILSLLIAFLRNNGIYVVIVTAIVLIILIRNSGQKIRPLVISVVSMVAVILIVQGPVYRLAGVEKSHTVESMGIPLQQVAYIVATEGNLSVEDEETIESIMAIDNWKYLYNPLVVDSLKFAPEFDREYFGNHIGEFIRMYASVCIRNPVKAVKGYLLATMGFWDMWQSSSSAYICKDHTMQSEYFMSDYMEYYFDFSWDDIVTPKHYISAGLIAWIMLLTFTYAVTDNKRRACAVLPVIPGLALWATLMIATPLAFSFRYIFPVFLCIPVYLMCINSVLSGKDE